LEGGDTCRSVSTNFKNLYNVPAGGNSMNNINKLGILLPRGLVELMDEDRGAGTDFEIPRSRYIKVAVQEHLSRISRKSCLEVGACQ